MLGHVNYSRVYTKFIMFTTVFSRCKAMMVFICIASLAKTQKTLLKTTDFLTNIGTDHLKAERTAGRDKTHTHTHNNNAKDHLENFSSF